LLQCLIWDLVCVCSVHRSALSRIRMHVRIKSLLKSCSETTVRQQEGKQASEKNDLASIDCCKRCSCKRFTSSDSILAARSCTILVLPGMSFCRRSWRSWSNKLRRFLSLHETVDRWWKVQELVYDTLHLLDVMCGCLVVCTCLLCYTSSFVGSSVSLLRGT
jgi:hypothetical protein